MFSFVDIFFCIVFAMPLCASVHMCIYNIVGAVSYSSAFQSQKQQFIIMVYYANQPRFELIITLYSLHDHD